MAVLTTRPAEAYTLWSLEFSDVSPPLALMAGTGWTGPDSYGNYNWEHMILGGDKGLQMRELPWDLQFEDYGAWMNPQVHGENVYYPSSTWDVDDVIVELSPAEPGYIPPPGWDSWGITLFLPGDADFDGDVDGVDFLTWQSNYSQTGTGRAPYTSGNFDMVGEVGGVDFLIWQTNYGVVAPIIDDWYNDFAPEPASAMLLLAGLPLLRKKR